MVSLENAVLFDAQSLLFLSVPRDLAFGDEYLFEKLPYPSVQCFAEIVAQSHDCEGRRHTHLTWSRT
jgi:hypothetical protein